MNIRRTLELVGGAVVVYAAVAACSSSGGRSGAGGGTGKGTVPEAQAAESEAGSRLRVRRLVAADGARSMWGWFDSERSEDCSFQEARDGVTRCLPQLTYAVETYADASCKDKLVWFSKGCKVAAYAYDLDDNAACSKSDHLREVGSLQRVTTVYLKQEDGRCVDTPAIRDRDYYRLGKEVPLDAFVSATIEAD